MTGVIAGAEDRGDRGKWGRHQASLFYADDGMVASSDPRWLQGDFNTLVGLFDRLVLRTNVNKIVVMVCCPFQAAGNLSEAAYGRRVAGEGPTYRERLKGRVSCRECGKLIAVVSLTSHLMTQHGRVAETRRRWITPATVAGPRTFQMKLPVKGGLWRCLVEGCPG